LSSVLSFVFFFVFFVFFFFSTTTTRVVLIRVLVWRKWREKFVIFSSPHLINKEK